MHFYCSSFGHLKREKCGFAYLEEVEEPSKFKQEREIVHGKVVVDFLSHLRGHATAQKVSNVVLDGVEVSKHVI